MSVGEKVLRSHQDITRTMHQLLSLCLVRRSVLNQQLNDWQESPQCCKCLISTDSVC